MYIPSGEMKINWGMFLQMHKEIPFENSAFPPFKLGILPHKNNELNLPSRLIRRLLDDQLSGDQFF